MASDKKTQSCNFCEYSNATSDALRMHLNKYHHAIRDFNYLVSRNRVSDQEKAKYIHCGACNIYVEDIRLHEASSIHITCFKTTDIVHEDLLTESGEEDIHIPKVDWMNDRDDPIAFGASIGEVILLAHIPGNGRDQDYLKQSTDCKNWLRWRILSVCDSDEVRYNV